MWDLSASVSKDDLKLPADDQRGKKILFAYKKISNIPRLFEIRVSVKSSWTVQVNVTCFFSTKMTPVKGFTIPVKRLEIKSFVQHQHAQNM